MFAIVLEHTDGTATQYVTQGMDEETIRRDWGVQYRDEECEWLSEGCWETALGNEVSIQSVTEVSVEDYHVLKKYMPQM